MRRRGFWSLAWAALRDLFDQSTGFGRLALVHVAMIAGDTLVAVSLAGSLFFSASPTAAKGKVLAYLLLTFLPFAVVSPILGPLIDRSVNGRRILVALSALSRVVLCYLMSRHLTSWLLFPEAFLVLVASKLYVVTRGTLVPEMARTNQFSEHAPGVNNAGWPSNTPEPSKGFAGFNAQLTLLGTVAGLVLGGVGAGIEKGLGAPSVLIAACVVFLFAGLVSFRLRRPSALAPTEENLEWELSPGESDEVELSWGLTAISILRFAVGFLSFLLVFGLRHEHAALSWYGAALTATGVGSLAGLSLVTRLQGRFRDGTLIATSLLLLSAGASVGSWRPSTWMQVGVAALVGLAGSIAQPSFDSITQRHVPPGEQGRTFARFAVRQQLLWVLGAIIPVAVTMEFATGDGVIAVLCCGTGLIYGVGRRYVK